MGSLGQWWRDRISIYTNFHFEKILAVLLYSALEFLSFCVMHHLHGDLKSCHVDWKSDLSYCIGRSISSIIKIYPRDEFTFSQQNPGTDVSVGFRPPCWCPSRCQQHGVFIQSCINLSKSFFQTFYIWKIALVCVLARVFACLPPLISQVLDFIYWTVLIFNGVTVKTSNRDGKWWRHKNYICEIMGLVSVPSPERRRWNRSIARNQPFSANRWEGISTFMLPWLQMNASKIGLDH